MYSNITELLNAGLSIPSLYELKNMDEYSKETMIPVIYKNVECINDECIDNTTYLELVNKASLAHSDQQKRRKKTKIHKERRSTAKKTSKTKKQKN